MVAVRNGGPVVTGGPQKAGGALEALVAAALVVEVLVGDGNGTKCQVPGVKYQGFLNLMIFYFVDVIIFL
jgi:hypothetical protein